MHFWVHGLHSVMIGRCISNTTKIHMWQFAHVSVITFLSLLEVHKQWFLELGMIMISSSSSFSSDCDCPMRIMMIKVFCSDISCERCVAGALFSRLISESWIATINVGTKKQQQMIFICSWEKKFGVSSVATALLFSAYDDSSSTPQLVPSSHFSQQQAPFCNVSFGHNLTQMYENCKPWENCKTPKKVSVGFEPAFSGVRGSMK